MLRFAEKRGLSASGIVDALSGSMDFGSSLPFACDEDGEYYLVITSKGRVREFEAEEGEEGDTLAECFDDFIEDYQKRLMSNQFEYVEGCGLMEKAGAGGGHK